MPAYILLRRWRVTLLSGLLLSTLPQAPAIAGFTVRDSARPASIQAGQTEQLTATVTTVYNHTGWSITSTVSFNGTPVASQSYTNLTFTGGVPVTETWNWPVPATATPGTYTFVVSAFDNNGIFALSATTTFSVTGGTVVNGQCGTANNAVTNTPPTSNLCSAGTPSAVTGTGPWFWSCAGSGNGTTASCSTAYASCPKGTTYVSVGDGCMKAQATGSVQTTNFFTGFTGQAYTVRPPWNVAGVDYAVGYSGTLTPATSWTAPACISSYNASIFIANADMQPCVISGVDFTVNGGYCFLVTGSGGNTVTFSNDHFATGTSNCTQYGGWIQMQAGTTANILVEYSEFDDNYGCNCDGVITMVGTGSVTVKYTAGIGITGRLEDIGNGSTGAIINQYNYIEGIGSTFEHGEVVEINSSYPYVYNELWNTYYTESTGCCDTALLYIQSAPATGPGTLTSAIDSYNVLVARPNPSQPLGGVTVSGPIWVDTSVGNTIGTVTITNNYIDPMGSFFPIVVNYSTTDPGSIGSSTCSGNISLVTGTLTDGITVTAGGALTGTHGSGTSTLVCH
jgi:hypothetical protein